MRHIGEALGDEIAPDGEHGAENAGEEKGDALTDFSVQIGPVAPLLAEGYAKNTLIDIRYISPELLDRFVTLDGQNVLFLYSVSVLNHSETIR